MFFVGARRGASLGLDKFLVTRVCTSGVQTGRGEGSLVTTTLQQHYNSSVYTVQYTGEQLDNSSNFSGQCPANNTNSTLW